MSFLEDNAGNWIPEPNTGCYLWVGGVTGGYPTLGKRHRLVNRIVLEDSAGPPPTSKHEAAHDTPNGCCGQMCVNPAHLRWATHQENMLDEHPENRSSRACRANASRTQEQRRASLQKAREAMTADIMTARALKGWTTRRKNHVGPDTI
jgi:hypothetical protein